MAVGKGLTLGLETTTFSSFESTSAPLPERGFTVRSSELYDFGIPGKELSPLSDRGESGGGVASSSSVSSVRILRGGVLEEGAGEGEAR